MNETSVCFGLHRDSLLQAGILDGTGILALKGMQPERPALDSSSLLSHATHFKPQALAAIFHALLVR